MVIGRASLVTQKYYYLVNQGDLPPLTGQTICPFYCRIYFPIFRRDCCISVYQCYTLDLVVLSMHQMCNFSNAI